MKIKFVSRLTVFALLLISVTQCLAANDKHTEAMQDLKAQVSKALSKKLEVTVKFKSGTIYKGEVTEVLGQDFYLQQKDASVAFSINYSDVASITVQNQFLKVMKRVGKAATWTALGIVGAPVLLVVAISDFAFGTHIAPW